jgi:hypothetical protein
VDEHEVKQMLEHHIRDQTKISREMLERITRVETKQDSLLQACPTCQNEIKEQGKAIVAVTESSKSAHYRIDGIRTSACLIATILGTVIGAVFTMANFVLNRGH